jgi:hypothetical protein
MVSKVGNLFNLLEIINVMINQNGYNLEILEHQNCFSEPSKQYSSNQRNKIRMEKLRSWLNKLFLNSEGFRERSEKAFDRALHEATMRGEILAHFEYTEYGLFGKAYSRTWVLPADPLTQDLAYVLMKAAAKDEAV